MTPVEFVTSSGGPWGSSLVNGGWASANEKLNRDLLIRVEDSIFSWADGTLYRTYVIVASEMEAS